MGLIYNLAHNFKKSIPIVAAKFGTFFLITFIFGMFYGYWIQNPLFLLGPILIVPIMWEKLDEGMLLLLALLILTLSYS